MFAAAAGQQLEHLYVSGSGLMWHSLAAAAPAEDVLQSLAAMRALKKVTFVVQTQVSKEALSGGMALALCYHPSCMLDAPLCSCWCVPLGWALFTVLGHHPNLSCPAPALRCSQKEEMPSVEVAQLMLALPRRCPHLSVEALDAEQFFGVTLKDLDAMP